MPFIHDADTAPAYWTMDVLWMVLADDNDTGGRFSLMKLLPPKGSGPGPYKHTWSDETFYMLNGEITLLVGDEIRTARKGDFGMVLALGSKGAGSLFQPSSWIAGSRSGLSSSRATISGRVCWPKLNARVGARWTWPNLKLRQAAHDAVEKASLLHRPDLPVTARSASCQAPCRWAVKNAAVRMAATPQSSQAAAGTRSVPDP